MGQKVLWLRGDLVERLREMRRQGFVMSAVVERALESFFGEGNEGARAERHG